MGYSNGLLSDNISHQTEGKQGPQGLPGVGFKLTSSGDFDIQNKKLTNVDTDENNDFCAVNMTTLKNTLLESHEKDKDIDLQDKYIVKNSKQQSFADLSSNYDNLVSYNDVKDIFLSRKETFGMEVALDMGNHTIFNVKNPTAADQGVNKRYADAETAKNRVEINRVEFDLNTNILVAQNQIKTKADKTYVDTENAKRLALSGGTMTGEIDMGGKKIVNVGDPVSNRNVATKNYVDDEVFLAKKFTIDSQTMKDECRYLMEDVNESSSEERIGVDGIVDYANSPHEINKKAYDLKLTKMSDNNYISRLGFNMYKLPKGDYTICIEFFPVDVQTTSVNAVSSTLGVWNFTTVSHRTIIHIRKSVVTTPDYLMIDLHCKGSPTSASRAQAYLIIYGVSGFHPDVSKSVYDYPYILESGSVVMQANLNMNNHTIINSPSLSKMFIINGFYDRSKNSTNVLFSGGEQVVIPISCKIVKCKIKIVDVLQTYFALSFNISSKWVQGNNNAKNQNFDLDQKINENEEIYMVLAENKLMLFNKCAVTLLLETT